MDKEVEDVKICNKIRKFMYKVYYLIRFPKGEIKIYIKEDIIK